MTSYIGISWLSNPMFQTSSLYQSLFRASDLDPHPLQLEPGVRITDPESKSRNRWLNVGRILLYM